MISVLQTLKEEWRKRKDLKDGERREFEQLENELRRLQSFLNDSANKSEKSELFREMEKQITELVYDLEDTIEICLTKKAAAKAKIFSRILKKSGTGLAKRVRTLREGKVKPILGLIERDFGKIDRSATTLEKPYTEVKVDQSPETYTHDQSTGQQSVATTQESSSAQDQSNNPDKVVDFEDEATIIEYLMEPKDRLDVISITGVTGVGKTTLARKIFHEEKVRRKFPLRIWIHVSQKFNSRDAFLDILETVRLAPQGTSSLSDEELITTVRRSLANKEFLLVIDDLWTVKDWEVIWKILPEENGKGKVVVTSRQKDVAGQVNIYREPHKLSLLNEKKSLELLKLKVFGDLESCPPELEAVVQDIANKCGGIPQVILVIGESLKIRFTKTRATVGLKENWKNVFEVLKYILQEENDNSISDISGEFGKIDTYATSLENPFTEVKLFRPTRSDRVVGFEDEEDTIIGYLTEPKEELDVISIIGERGLGKTTLARKIYQCKRISDEFPIRIWTRFSRNSDRDVFLNILKMFISQDMSNLSYQELIETSRACLEKEKFLLVLDGLCSRDDWKVIQNILPHSNDKSKVLITSIDNYVEADVDRSPVHKLRFLTTEESWKLLQLEVFGNLEDCPLELEKIGKLIADKCGGLPLRIEVVGGILVGELMKSDDQGSIIMGWQKVYENGNLFLHNEKSISDAVELNYSSLPDDLRECFLYMGVFPEGYEISVWTLTCLWIAEGFILPDQRKQSLEETATQNLYDLIGRNLVMVDKMNPIGEVKTCRIHFVIRAFCIHKAREQNLFQEIKRSEDGALNLQNIRRLCVNSDVDTFLSEVPKIPCVRSFLCFSKELVHLNPRNISSISDAYILLRVLDSKSIKSNLFPTRITELILLRYITLSIDDLHVLPQSLSKLWNLQTLVVDTTSRLITMEADIWRLIGLRHLKTNAAIVLSSQGKGKGKAGENLQTLNTLSPKSCTEDVSERAHNLKRLRIRGELSTLFGNKFLEKLVRLEKLKLVNDIHQNLPCDLPQLNCFPPYLKKLTLSNTFLKWTHMSTLSEIRTLEVLKLRDNAFTGIYWKVEEDCFHSLQFLLIANTELVIWEASTESLPSLRYLVLKNCGNLNEFPVSLKNLQIVEMERVNKSAVIFARSIAEKKEKSGLPFKLSIAPAGC